MVEILQDFSPSVVTYAIDSNHIAYQSLFSTLPGAERYDEDEVSWFTTGLPHDTFNGVLQMRVKSADLNATIDRVRTFFEQRHLPFIWPLGSASYPLNCGPALQACGLTFIEEEPEMAVDLYALNEDIQLSSSLEVLQVTNHEQLLQWMHVWLFPVPEEIPHTSSHPRHTTTEYCHPAYTRFKLQHLFPLAPYGVRRGSEGHPYTIGGDDGYR